MFRRRRRPGEPAEPADEAFDEGFDEAVEEQEAAEVAAAPAGTDEAGLADFADEADLADSAAQVELAGPYDAAEVPNDGIPRLDLGGMLVPILDGMEVRVDVDPQGQVVAATLVDGESMMQLGAFAAPRSAGIWDEVRTEIADTLRAAGGSAEEAPGPYGTELNAQVPIESGQTAPARFVGVDRPRWFLRALLSGPAAVDAGQAERLEAAIGLVVVARGSEAMPARDPIPLRLPQEALDAAAQAAADSAAEEAQTGGAGGRAQPDFNPLQRGPEITETR